MSTTTASFEHHATATTDTAPRKGFLHWLIEARKLQGEARARAALASMPDHRLADLGFTPDQIRHVRSNGNIPSTFWL